MLCVLADLRLRHRREFEELRAQCEWKSDGHQAQYCVLPAHGPDGEAYLGVVHYPVGLMSHVAAATNGAKTVHHSWSGHAFRRAIAAAAGAKNYSSWPHTVWITSGATWPIDAATFAPVAYPPAHFHHSSVRSHRHQQDEYSILEMQSRRKHDVGSFAFEADSYCEDCDESHALWMSYPSLHGEPWPWDTSDLSSSGMVEVRSVLRGCPAKFEPRLNVSIELAVRVLVRPAGSMAEVWGISSSMAGYGDPTDRAGVGFDGRSQLASTLMRVPPHRSILQYEELTFVTSGYNVARDHLRPEHLKVHSHPEWLDSIFVIAGDAASAGLGSFDFGTPSRDFARAKSKGHVLQQRHNGRLPLLLNSSNALIAAKARILARLSNGLSAARKIPRLGVTEADVERAREASNGGGAGHAGGAPGAEASRARLLCVHVPAVTPKPLAGCRLFARRAISIEPPDGKCLFDWKAGDAHTWVLFATNDDATPVDMHATIRYSIHADPLPKQSERPPKMQALLDWFHSSAFSDPSSKFDPATHDLQAQIREITMSSAR